MFYVYSCEHIHIDSLKRYFCFNRLPYSLRSVGKTAYSKRDKLQVQSKCSEV